jgi:hypothetical protein
MKRASIKKEGSVYVVRSAPGANHVAGLAGVTCLNPGAGEADRIYEKRFFKKPIYMPRDYERAVREVLSGKDVIVIGMNGYSSLTDEQCRAWGVRPGAYEAACAGLLEAACAELSEAFPRIDIRFAHGASDWGIDGVILKVAAKLERPQLGHSCPQFMFYVTDDDVPVYCAADKVKYANAFIDSLQILLACNGRVQAFEHDIDACFKKLKHVIPLNVLKSISTTGGPPAIGADGKIEDAVAAFEQRVHMQARQISLVGKDAYLDIVGHVSDVTVSITRQLISPDRAFSNVRAKR